MLNAIGYFIEDVYDRDFPAPQELVREGNAEIADYLEKGLECTNYRGFSWCRFSCGKPDEEMGSRDLTDGKWVWPEGLVHYVRAHSVALPLEFCNHALVNTDFSMPSKDDEYDFSIWKSWSHRNRNIYFLNNLRKARSEFDEIIFKEKEKILQEKGTSKEICRYANCSNYAIDDVMFCMDHIPLILLGLTLQVKKINLLKDVLKRVDLY